MSTNGVLTLTERADAPDTPDTGDWRVYAKAAGLFYVDDAGAESQISTGGGSSNPNFGAAATKTLVSDVCAVGSDRNIIVAAQSSTADDLVEVTGLTVGDKVLLRADAGDTITVKHNSGSATIKILIQDDADFILDEVHPLELVLLSTNVLAQVYDEVGAGGGGLYTSLAILLDVKATTVAGGSCSATTWNARDVNTEHYDPDSIVSIASNQFTPITGDYEIDVSAPSYKGGKHRIRLYNVTGTAVVQGGTAAVANAPNSDASTAFLTCKFTANGTDAYRIDHYTNAAQATNGLGLNTDDGSSEIYMTIVLRKLS